MADPAAEAPPGEHVGVAGSGVTKGGGASLWSVVPKPMTYGRFGHTATLLQNGPPLQNGKVLVTGGNIAEDGFLKYAELYDPVKGEWVSVGPMTTARSGHTATLLPNGKVLVAGGVEKVSNNPTGLQDAELFDPSTNNWSAAGKGTLMTSGRVHHTATWLPNVRKVLVVGGDGKTPATADLYDPMADTWSQATSPMHDYVWHTATYFPSDPPIGPSDPPIGPLSGTVLVAGGGFSEVYDPVQNAPMGKWTSTSTMAEVRSQFTATLLPNGTVLAAGSWVGYQTPSDASAELFDPMNNHWSSLDPNKMGIGRYIHTATLLPDRQVLVAGGTKSGDWSVVNSAELFDVEKLFTSTSPWSPAGLMSEPRGEHTATLLLPSDQVLIVGGTVDGKNGLATAELYSLPVGGPGGAGGVGAPCTSVYDCQSGFCVSGVCCSTKCDAGLCEVCSVAAGADADGTCKPLTRPSQACRSGYCADGVCCDTPCDKECHSCVLPGSIGTCALEPAGLDIRQDCDDRRNCGKTCGGDGTCVPAGPGTQCELSRCLDETSGIGPVMCPSAGGKCPAEEGVPFNCSPYRCEQSSGACAKVCNKTSDCAPGFVCNPGGRCVTPPDKASGEDSACALGASRPFVPSDALLAVFGALALARRRRRDHPRTSRS